MDETLFQSSQIHNPETENDQIKQKLWVDVLNNYEHQIDRILLSDSSNTSIEKFVSTSVTFLTELHDSQNNGVFIRVNSSQKKFLSSDEFTSLDLSTQLAIKNTFSICITKIIDSIKNSWLEYSSGVKIDEKITKMFTEQDNLLWLVINDWSQPTSAINHFINKEAKEKITILINTYTGFKEYYSSTNWERKIEKAASTQEKLQLINNGFTAKILSQSEAIKILSSMNSTAPLQLQDVYNLHPQLVESHIPHFSAMMREEIKKFSPALADNRPSDLITFVRNTLEIIIENQPSLAEVFKDEVQKYVDTNIELSLEFQLQKPLIDKISMLLTYHQIVSQLPIEFKYNEVTIRKKIEDSLLATLDGQPTTNIKNSALLVQTYVPDGVPEIFSTIYDDIKKRAPSLNKWFLETFLVPLLEISTSRSYLLEPGSRGKEMLLDVLQDLVLEGSYTKDDIKKLVEVLGVEQSIEKNNNPLRALIRGNNQNNTIEKNKQKLLEIVEQLHQPDAELDL